MSDRPDYGPGGYLPQRAAKRARKIVLREPLGKGWIIASVVAAVVMAAIGAVYLVTQTGPPGDPFREVGPLEAVDPRGAETALAGDTPILVVRGAGGVRVFEAPPEAEEVVWCRETQRIESPRGHVWDLSGRLRGGEGTSLAPMPAEVHDATLYVDVDTALPAPAASADEEQPGCVLD